MPLKLPKKLLYNYLPLFLLIMFLIFPILIFVGKKPVEKMMGIYRTMSSAVLDPLSGPVPQPKPIWSFQNLFSGTWQQQITTWFSENIPFRTLIIRSHNQFFYQWFSKSYMMDGTLIIGKKKYLFQYHYIDRYCNSSHIAYHPEQFDEWAKKIQIIANFFESRGQKFFFIITPSKAGYFPEYFPKDFKCHPSIPRINYILGLQALNKFHISYLDSSQLLLEQKPKLGKLLFPRGGIHWSNLGAAIATKELVRKISLATQNPNLTFNFSYAVTHQPVGTDTDLLNLSNLLFPAKNYITAAVNIQPTKPKFEYKPPSMALVGGSFLFEIIFSLQPTHLFSSVDYYFYLNQHHFLFPAASLEKVEIPIAADANYKALLNADIVILEENESNVGVSDQVNLLAKIISTK